MKKKILKLSEIKKVVEKQDFLIPTGDIILDYILGGGLPCSLTVITGTPGSGKTTLALFFAKVLLQKNFEVWYFDIEKQLNPKWVLKILDTKNEEQKEDNFILCSPKHFEDMVFTINKEIFNQKSKKDNDFRKAFIWDSVAGTPLKSESEMIERTTEKTDLLKEFSMTGLSRVLSIVLKDFVSKLTYLGIPSIVINQFRQKVDFSPKFGKLLRSIFGEKGNAPGGFALKHHAFIYIETLRGPSERDLGFWVILRVLKNKQNKPMETAYFFSYDYGFDTHLNLIKLAIKEELIEKSGGWYKWEDKNFRINELIEYIIKNDEQKKKIEEFILSKFDVFKGIKNILEEREEDEEIEGEKIIIEEESNV